MFIKNKIIENKKIENKIKKIIKSKIKQTMNV